MKLHNNTYDNWYIVHFNNNSNTWFQYIAQRQLQDETRNILVLGFGAACIIIVRCDFQLWKYTQLLSQVYKHMYNDFFFFFFFFFGGGGGGGWYADHINTRFHILQSL